MRVCSRYNIIAKRPREETFEWILSHPNVKPPYISSNIVTIFNSEANQKEKFPRILVYISVRYLHNDRIKSPKNGGLASVVDSMTQKVLISDKSLRLFIVPQVR